MSCLPSIQTWEAGWSVQRSLSKAQATPIVGPLLVSPIKALVSVAELIVGIAGSILFGTLAVLTFNDYLGGKAVESLGHAGLGLLSLMYSISNILSLGLVGYRFEVISQ